MSVTFASFPIPTAGDVVLCRFPEDLGDLKPGPKARPAIILAVFAPIAAEACYRVKVCYGTSNVSRIYPHDCPIYEATHPAEFASAGLSYDTKFNAKQMVTLPYTVEWLTISIRPAFGQTPKIGILHPMTVPRLKKAVDSTNLQGQSSSRH